MAEENEAECLIIELDTPGGLLSSTRTIARSILSSQVPVVTYVYPPGARAGSAGVFITYASHIAAMAPSTNIGAAHPVTVGREKQDFRDLFRPEEKDEEKSFAKKRKKEEKPEDILGEKILQDTIAFIKAMAEKRGRNERWAIKSITESASITSEEALKINVINMIADNEADLLQKLHGLEVPMNGIRKKLNTRGAKIQTLEMDWRQRFFNVLANPNIAYILMMLGFYGLLYEITHPGFGIPGVAGAIMIILAFFAMQTLPTNYAGLALIVLGLALFAAEAFAPGLGIFMVGGLISLVLGSLLLFDRADEWTRISLPVIAGFTVGTAAITLVLMRLVLKTFRRRGVVGAEGLVGAIGTVDQSISAAEAGKVYLHGEIWNAVSDEELKPGDKVEVTKVDGLELHVKKK